MELYLAPLPASTGKALILFPDVWGWNSGRIRAIADALAGEGYIVAVPKILTPSLDGGTDGDALPPKGSFSMDWIKNFPWEVQKPKVDAVLSFVRAKGGAKIGVVGICYGAHPACWVSSENEDVVCGVTLHPSVQLEQFAFGGDCAKLLESVKCPFLFMPAGNDLPMWAEEGPFGQALKASAKGASCVFKPYPDIAHGFFNRGDVSDENIKRDVGLAVADAKAFFASHMG